MSMIAYQCPDIMVYVMDISKPLIKQWNSDTLPIYEPGLDAIVKSCRGRNLHFVTDLEATVAACDTLFICVNTPTKTFGVGKGKAADLTAWELAARSVAKYTTSPKIIVEKSTVPVRTADALRRVLDAEAQHPNAHYVIVSNPEFLAEGSAMEDLKNPDRVLIGGHENTRDGQWAIQRVADIYARWVPLEKILTTSVWSAELSKLVANALLAQRISSMNSIAMLCEKTGANVQQVSRAVGADSRIGSKYLSASVGFGGSCLQKDVLSLTYLCEAYGLHEAARYWESVKTMNDWCKSRFTQRVIHSLFNTVRGKKLAIFGFAFKKDTGDTRATPALDVCAALITEGAQLYVYDPKVTPEAAAKEFSIRWPTPSEMEFYLPSQFQMTATAEEAVEGAHAIIVLTEWTEFKTYDYKHFYTVMKHPAFIFDGRNLLDHPALANIGFEVHPLGQATQYPALYY